MAYEIVIGRSEHDKKKYGLKGSIFLGRHYVKMGQTTSLSSDIFLDVNRTHVVFICGKRGSGKSYTMGSIAEGIADLPEEVKNNICTIIFDTMGIYWTMKFPNKKDEALLKQWNLEGKSLDVKIYTPKGFYKQYKEKGIPTDSPFSIRPSDLTSSDWILTFGLDANTPSGVLLERVINKLKKEGTNYTISDIIKEIKADKNSSQNDKNMVENQFRKTKEWGLFSKEGTPIEDLTYGGRTIIIDLSHYATQAGTWGIKSLVIGIISQRVFLERMAARKTEEHTVLKKSERYFTEEEKKKIARKTPLIWIMIDEAHEFLPYKGTTAATNALVTILREGRQPGVSLILASQQPGKIHTDVMTQADTVLSHRLTAKVDVDALGKLMQSYMRHGLDEELNKLPRVKGAAIVFDDLNEKLYPIQMKPRFTWHGGEAPIAIEEKEKKFEL
jgi:ABC-type dipeptide/oligopeptide/nickel transport system ATPase component